MRIDNSKFSPPAEDILDAAADTGLRTSTNGQSSIQNSLHAPLGHAERLRHGHAQETRHRDDNHARPGVHDDPLPNPSEREGHQ